MNSWKHIQGIYVHIPFCLQKCLYCDFASFASIDDETMVSYTNKLCAEIRQCNSLLPINPQATVYFGGGTPTVLPLECLGKIITVLKDKGFWQEPLEATIEANPGTVSLESLRAYHSMGFNRISFGIQSIHDLELKAMGRIHTAYEALEAIKLARTAGFANISADLIYGYPTQTLESVMHSVQFLIKQKIEHLSVYGLTVEEGTELQKKIASKELLLPSEDSSGDMYDFIVEFLPQQNYKRYEISNYAPKGRESKHNLVYWQYLPYLGFGVSACTFTGKERKTNPYNIAAYLHDEQPLREDLSPNSCLAEYIFMGLRTSKGINWDLAYERFNVDIMKLYYKEISECQRKGLLQIDVSRASLRLTELGMKFGNQVFEKFL